MEDKSKQKVKRTMGPKCLYNPTSRTNKNTNQVKKKNTQQIENGMFSSFGDYCFDDRNSIPYPNQQGMRVYSSLWNADNWATRGGLVKIDRTSAPFVANYRRFRARA